MLDGTSSPPSKPYLAIKPNNYRLFHLRSIFARFYLAREDSISSPEPDLGTTDLSPFSSPESNVFLSRQSLRTILFWMFCRAKAPPAKKNVELWGREWFLTHVKKDRDLWERDWAKTDWDGYPIMRRASK